MSRTPYRHSGRLGTALWRLPLIGASTATALGALYGLIAVYLVFVKITALIAVGIGLAIGGICSWVCERGRCRNPGFTFTGVLLAGLMAVYAAWTTYEWCALDMAGWRTLARLWFQPDLVRALAMAISDGPGRTVGNATWRGGWLLLVWLVEAGLVVGPATMIALWGLAGRVYCERCDRWCRTAKDLVRLERPRGINRAFSFDEIALDVLAGWTVAPTMSADYVRVDAWHCDECDQTSVYEVERVLRGRERRIPVTDRSFASPSEWRALTRLAALPIPESAAPGS